MLLRVKFGNEKYDYVNGEAIDDLIERKEICMFYRPSEKRWIDVEVGPIRAERGIYYIGPERRSVIAVNAGG